MGDTDISFLGSTVTGALANIGNSYTVICDEAINNMQGKEFQLDVPNYRFIFLSFKSLNGENVWNPTSFPIKLLENYHIGFISTLYNSNMYNAAVVYNNSSSIIVAGNSTSMRVFAIAYN